MSDRIMFSEMKIGGVYENVPLVVIQATPKVSKNGKNYLSMILSDGKNQLPCKYWDWGGNNLPEKNTIYDFNLECDEYNSTKQLICRKVMRNTDNTINDFLKNVEIDIDTLYENALLLANGIEDDFYREITVEAMTRYKKRWLTVPASKRNHHAFPGGMLLHSYNVAMMSKMNAAFMKGAWTDLAVAGGLLHDIGKLFEYVQAGIEIEITDVAILMDHLFIGAEIVKDLAKEKIHSPKDREKLRLLQHIILSHHREREYGAIVYPKTIEAWIVAHADALDAECQAIREANEKIATENMFTERIWSVNNAEHVTIWEMERLSNQDLLNKKYNELEDCLLHSASERSLMNLETVSEHVLEENTKEADIEADIETDIEAEEENYEPNEEETDNDIDDGSVIIEETEENSELDDILSELDALEDDAEIDF